MDEKSSYDSTEPSRRQAGRAGRETPGRESRERPAGKRPAGEGEGRPGGRANWQTSLREAGPYIGMGFQLGGTVALFLGAGYLVDRWLGSLPYGTIVGGVLGMAAALLFIARVNKELSGGSESSTSSSTSSERK